MVQGLWLVVQGLWLTHARLRPADLGVHEEVVPDREAENMVLGGEREAEAAHVVREVLLLDQLARHLFQGLGFRFSVSGLGFRVSGKW